MTTRHTSELPEYAEGAIRNHVRQELRNCIGYDLPLLDAYIALASATLVISSQLANTGLSAMPNVTFPIAVDEVNHQRAKILARYFADAEPGQRFYFLCRAKNYQERIPLDPPWIDESAVLALAAGIADPAKAGLTKKVKGKRYLIADPGLDRAWRSRQDELPTTDFTPNRLEGAPVHIGTLLERRRTGASSQHRLNTAQPMLL